MSALNVRLPESLHQALRELAAQEGVSMNQLITQALQTEIYLQERSQRGSRTKFDSALQHVADTDPERDQDKLNSM